MVNYIEGKRSFREEIMNVQSRYYNPELGRFLNADAIGGSIGALEGSFGDGLKEIPDYIEYCVNRQAWRHGGTLIPVEGALLITASTPIWATAAIGVGTFVAVTAVGVAIDWGQLK
ncbi:hypothetical protein [Clostridium sp. UBA3061]|uniref:hypothetical protein n=1 Tax=Clostridium sp. UBA3061 TaxID=1946353 RepID=UPI003217B285